MDLIINGTPPAGTLVITSGSDNFVAQTVMDDNFVPSYGYAPVEQIHQPTTEIRIESSTPAEIIDACNRLVGTVIQGFTGQAVVAPVNNAQALPVAEPIVETPTPAPAFKPVIPEVETALEAEETIIEPEAKIETRVEAVSEAISEPEAETEDAQAKEYAFRRRQIIALAEKMGYTPETAKSLRSFEDVIDEATRRFLENRIVEDIRIYINKKLTEIKPRVIVIETIAPLTDEQKIEIINRINEKLLYNPLGDEVKHAISWDDFDEKNAEKYFRICQIFHALKTACEKAGIRSTCAWDLSKIIVGSEGSDCPVTKDDMVKLLASGRTFAEIEAICCGLVHDANEDASQSAKIDLNYFGLGDLAKELGLGEDEDFGTGIPEDLSSESPAEVEEVEAAAEVVDDSKKITPDPVAKTMTSKTAVADSIGEAAENPFESIGFTKEESGKLIAVGIDNVDSFYLGISFEDDFETLAKKTGIDKNRLTEVYLKIEMDKKAQVKEETEQLIKKSKEVAAAIKKQKAATIAVTQEAAKTEVDKTPTEGLASIEELVGAVAILDTETREQLKPPEKKEDPISDEDRATLDALGLRNGDLEEIIKAGIKTPQELKVFFDIDDGETLVSQTGVKKSKIINAIEKMDEIEEESRKGKNKRKRE